MADAPGRQVPTTVADQSQGFLEGIRSRVSGLGDVMTVVHGTTVATNVKIPAILGGDNTNIFALRFCAFTGTTRDRKFDFMWRAQSLVTVF